MSWHKNIGKWHVAYRKPRRRHPWHLRDAFGKTNPSLCVGRFCIWRSK